MSFTQCQLVSPATQVNGKCTTILLLDTTLLLAPVIGRYRKHNSQANLTCGMIAGARCVMFGLFLSI